MLDKILIEEKIKNIKEYLQEIEGLISLDVEDLLKDIRNVRTLERDFQLVVDEILDINLHFIQELDLKTPDDFQSTFSILAGELGIFPEEFARRISPAVGLRNILVHRYEKVDKRFFVGQVKKEHRDFTEYMEWILKYIDKLR